MSPDGQPTQPAGLTVVDPGVEVTVQDHPGRVGMQRKGFFPAGPVDHFALRAANLLVGNESGAAALEIPMGRFSARVQFGGLLCLCGAEGSQPELNGSALPMWESVPVEPGDTLTCRTAKGPGFRLYLAVSGGLATPRVFGSRSTHTVGGIGGLDGRPLIRGDLVPVAAGHAESAARRLRMPQVLRPTYPTHWEIEVMRGPHPDPDFITSQDWAEFVYRTWRVNLNSDRLATRLDTHKFTWARPDGGVAGGHPSNVLDGSYPFGGVLMNGDEPMILGPDGPTSGGFTVLATVVHAALWRIGQLRPGRDTLRFREIDFDEALALAERVEFALDPAHYELI